ncbi:hypothetical protein PAPYR_4397 [Paratrimastix pyriformis]|uniref:Uncharacterized protein n=1 Tax=Paratrimastix pyriformis TaxID=342808 RepID=A0ABQ8UQ30_9EUKA|nr:hypothetical protein PAPYR_4397 [Paratrimastix pyriformis]
MAEQEMPAPKFSIGEWLAVEEYMDGLLSENDLTPDCFEILCQAEHREKVIALYAEVKAANVTGQPP